LRASSASKSHTLLEPEIPGNETSVATGKVTNDLGEAGLEIEIGDAIVAARVGFGCLVQPIAGDRVLVARTPSGTFVLSVLERLVPDSATLSLPSGGALRVEATDIRLVARGEASIDAPNVDVRAERFNVIADSLTLLGRVGNWVAETLRISAKTQETVADTLSAKAINRVTIVERADVLRAASVSQTIDNVAVTTAPAVVIATTEDLRLDGKRVTVG
jgi:hypothetical protein